MDLLINPLMRNSFLLDPIVIVFCFANGFDTRFKSSGE
ncbi:Uncharacterised protein [Streptococcus pneumoniae]|nr:Uncharacterised protein [Streptococcus pneumoniae]